MKILIGCPVYKRDWILPYWFESIENQTIPLSDLGFIFELGTPDEETHEMLWEWHSRHPEVEVFDGIIRADETHKTHQEDKRQWARSDYYRMVNFRNNLLERAINYAPERYFSLDSDIVLTNQNTLQELYNLTDSGCTAAPLCYMTPEGDRFPNIMNWADYPGGKAKRKVEEYPIGEVFEVEISMAAVMMAPEVYRDVRYRWHRQGEDLGWSAEVTRHGYKMYSASNIYSSHIMHRWMLNEFIGRGDPRQPAFS
jgi:hypothetical protein